MSALSQSDADAVFELLVSAYDATPADQAQALLARICLLLAQRVGDVAIVRDAIQKATDADDNFRPSSPSTSSPKREGDQERMTER